MRIFKLGRDMPTPSAPRGGVGSAPTMQPVERAAIDMLLSIAEGVAERHLILTGGMDGGANECPFECGVSERSDKPDAMVHQPDCPVSMAAALGFVADAQTSASIAPDVRALVAGWRESR